RRRRRSSRVTAQDRRHDDEVAIGRGRVAEDVFDPQGRLDDVIAEDVLELDRLCRRRDRRRVELGQLGVLVEDVVELAFQPIELGIGEAEASEEGDVLDVRAGKAGHRRMILNGMAATAPLPRLRPMTPSDVDAATELILGNDWGVRREWLEFATTQPACTPLVAEADG